MAEFDGTYTRKTGAKRAYTYQAIYGMHGGVLHWSALVNCAGELKGHPNGTVVLAQRDAGSELGIAEICITDAIEGLVGMNE
jgi:hypothetical protein